MKKITIIGGGASGTLLAVNLIRNAGDEPIEINIIEKRSRLGRGVAFGTSYASHLLNVPAGKMGAFPDDIEHFHRWLVASDHEYESHAFVPRMLFGQYLREVFADAVASGSANTAILHIEDEAVEASRADGGVRIALRSGESVESDHAVLAFGNFDPPHPSVSDLAFTDSDKYFRSPWTPRIYESVGSDESIFVIGTGLSTVDVTIHFHQIGHRGKITAISTRGILPAVHELGYTYPSFNHELIGISRITDLLKAVRRHIASAESDSSNWRAVIDSLRPATQQIWQDLPVAEKRYFKQHLSRYWNAARHRMPPEAGAILDEMQKAGTFEVLKGRLKNIGLNSDAKFSIDLSSDGVPHHATADVLVNCIGAESNFAKVESELVRSMLASGLVRRDELLMGLDATRDGRVIGSDGVPSEQLFTLGTALKGILWETTAIPEIRSQARALALKLLSN